MTPFKRILLHPVGDYSRAQLLTLTSLRVIIGWHFLYAGVVKVTDPLWSAAPYLQNAQGPFANLFHKLAIHPLALQFVNFLNAWGAVVIGACLILGLFSMPAKFFGVCLLAVYYISMPPLIGHTITIGGSDDLLLVNGLIVEIFALIVLWFFPTGRQTGLDMFVSKLIKNEESQVDGAP